MVEMSDEDALAWEIGREMAREESEFKNHIDLERQLAEYQVAVFDMLDEAMSDGA